MIMFFTIKAILICLLLGVSLGGLVVAMHNDRTLSLCVCVCVCVCEREFLEHILLCSCVS